jgi:hypothetical protein
MATPKAMTRSVPIGLLVLGGLFVVVNLGAIAFGYYFPKWLAATPAVILVGIAMLLFPGAEPPAEIEQAKRTGYFFAKAPLLNKIAWVVSGAAGVALGVYVMIRFDPGF